MPDTVDQSALLYTGDPREPFVGVRARLLPLEEWHRVADYGPFKEAGCLPSPDHAILLVLERWDGTTHSPRIVGCWMAKDTVILEGMYLNPEERKIAPVARKYVFSMVEALKSRGVTEVLTLVNSPEVHQLAPKVGFAPLPGVIYLLKLPKEGT